ncbi:hypothetical protein B0H16DRAFT_1752474 [Mycena metata]|uniref:Uncharacterized protein n=1 Tax=Mycena metata TaxID=1033252 RepID=A0AAD7GH35_9AGAR|nr:hypothetical protein B0H16DRAFT_1752474 [Mycena metata]
MNVSTIFRPPYRPHVLERQIQLPLFFRADEWCLPTSARHHRSPIFRSSPPLADLPPDSNLPRPPIPTHMRKTKAPSRPFAFVLYPSLSISHTLLSSFLSSTCADFRVAAKDIFKYCSFRLHSLPSPLLPDAPCK